MLPSLARSNLLRLQPILTGHLTDNLTTDSIYLGKAVRTSEVTATPTKLFRVDT